MRPQINTKLKLGEDVLDFIDLYRSLQTVAENFLPPYFLDLLKNFNRLCFEEADDPVYQQKEIKRQLMLLKEAYPAYTDVSLMLFPHEESKAFQYRSRLNRFRSRLVELMDTELINEEKQDEARQVLQFHDFSMGTPPFTQKNLQFRFNILLGEEVSALRRFREVLGINEEVEKSQWNYLMDVLEQMVVQSAHYTTSAEKADFLERMSQNIHLKGLNGFLKTAVSGSPDTAVKLIKEELFNPEQLEIITFKDSESLLEQLQQNKTAVFVIKIQSLSANPFSDPVWFPFLSRMIFVDDSPMAQRANISLVFCFHNKIIQSLNKVHTKKLGALANSQMNLRLLLEKVSFSNLKKFKSLVNQQIRTYENELIEIKKEQLGETDDPLKNLNLFKLDEFSRQIIKDKYSLEKLGSYLELIMGCTEPSQLKKLNRSLIETFEQQTLKYFYSGNKKLHIATIVEGGGRNQIKTYGEYLLQRKLVPVDKEIVNRCRVMLDVFPDTYQRTLKNHFHKNFGINIFLEKYQHHLIKAENEADNTGRLKNMLIDLGILEKYNTLSGKEQNIIKEFISNLTNLKKTSISDDVQMIIRDVLFGKEDKVLKPYILFNKYASWEYLDLFPTDRFDINPFDLEIGITPEGRIDFERLTNRLERMKNTFQIFDETGSLWDRFSENLTIVINDPSNPSGYSDFNNQNLLEFLKFISTSKITLFLDEAYNDTIKIANQSEPKWRTISRYVMDNIDQKYNRLNLVSSISTTKNLGATGDRLGALIATNGNKAVIDFARKKNNNETGNTNSLYMLVNILQTAQLAKAIKNRLEEKLPKNASRYKFKNIIEQYLVETCGEQSGSGKTAKKNFMPIAFEGSPLHLFLLNELVALDKLDMLELPDDFKYKDEPFFAYYQKQLVSSLNSFRVNKNFRTESLKRLNLAKKTGEELLAGEAGKYARVVPSDGSFLFNIQLKYFFSYQDLEKFTQKLAEQRGIAVIPYQNGFLRFSLGGYLEGNASSYDVFQKEIKNALEIVLIYWQKFYEAKEDEKNKGRGSDDLLEEIFSLPSERAFMNQVLADFNPITHLKKQTFNSLLIDNKWTIYHAPPRLSGVSIHTIDNSVNAVIEFSDELGRCTSLPEFIQSRAFTSIYENLLPQVYPKIPAIKHWPFSRVLALFGKSELLKYISNKLNYEPNNYVLDGPDEDLIMAEILLEMEKLLFSSGKTKILALKSSGNHRADVARMEGVNQILKKNIRELLFHFNLPFENKPASPSLKELIEKTAEKFDAIIGINLNQIDLDQALKTFGEALYQKFEDKNLDLGKKLFGDINRRILQNVYSPEFSATEQVIYFYLLTEKSRFQQNMTALFDNFCQALSRVNNKETEVVIGNFLYRSLPGQWNLIWAEVLEIAHEKVAYSQIHNEIRWFVLFLIKRMNSTKANEHYYPYVHTIMRLAEAEFTQQNSSINEMVQHGISVYEHFDIQNHKLLTGKEKQLEWIPDLLSRCGVIATEQNVQTHTRIVTDSKKREFPFHRLDRIKARENKALISSDSQSNEYIKIMDSRPKSSFFINRLKQFMPNMDFGDYRCKIFNGGLVNELFIFHKSYMKYLTDNFRLMEKQEVSLEDINNFIPDTICFYGLPEKLISFPQIGYFDIAGPRGNIKTIIAPLRKEVDYFGDIKKPRLTVMNEKVKEMGGIPIHGSMFAVEEEDGAVFVVQISGDSGVGKSEMLAAMMLKWMKNNLTGVRSLKMIAGDMLHVFPDTEGNLYGIGTEEGDFSRVTDFDPEYIKYYNSLFESASDSNVEDLNSRSTISGLCDVSMPYKIDIMLTASNFAREEAGITRYENPENFILYRNSHGERKEKATSGDNPNFQRTLMRYTGDKEIVEVMDQHGAYIDDVLDWEYDTSTGRFYLCSSYKMIELLNLEEIVNKIFTEKVICRNEKEWTIQKVTFDIIKNRFIATLIYEEEEVKQMIDRNLFNSLFDALASTPAGQPFVSEEGEFESKKHLIDFLKNRAARKIQLGILSTDLGRKGKEITGPQIAAEDMRRLIREVRNARPDISENKNRVMALIQQLYGQALGQRSNAEIDRYNFWLWQMEKMQKAELVRIDRPEERIDLSHMKKRIQPKKDFQPLLVTPNLNTEISAMSETYSQLMQLPEIETLVKNFTVFSDRIFIADNYSEETTVNNIIVQLLLMNHYILSEDLTKGRLMEKVDRETLAAAKFAALEILKGKKTA